jgi:DNA-binding CsgD family transcriptional regulator
MTEGHDRLLQEEIVRSQARARVHELSGRETDVLTQLVRGLSNKEIGRALSISHRTVEIHRANMMSKLGANSTGDAVRIGVRAGLDEVGDTAELLASGGCPNGHGRVTQFTPRETLPATPQTRGNAGLLSQRSQVTFFRAEGCARRRMVPMFAVAMTPARATRRQQVDEIHMGPRARGISKAGAHRGCEAWGNGCMGWNS